MICPWEHCTAEFLPTARQANPGRPEIVEVVPWHQVAGEGRWFGTCPATHLIVPTLTSAGRNVLAEASRHFERMRADRPAAEPRTATPPPAAPKAGPRSSTDWFNPVGSGGGRNDGPAARPKLELVPDLHVIQGEGSGNMSDALRDQLRALAMLAVESLQQVQLQAAEAERRTDNLAATATNLIDTLDVQLRGLLEKVEASETVARAAIGSDNPPESASNMIAAAGALREKVELAEARLTGLTTEVEAMAAEIKQSLSEVLGLAHAGAESGEMYARSI